MELFRKPCAIIPAHVHRLDRFRKATRNEDKAAAGGHRAARGRQDTWLEMTCRQTSKKGLQPIACSVKLLYEGNPRAALREFENTAAGASDVLHKADALFNVAICHVRLGPHTAAIEAIAAAVALDPTLVAEFALIRILVLSARVTTSGRFCDEDPKTGLTRRLRLLIWPRGLGVRIS